MEYQLITYLLGQGPFTADRINQEAQAGWRVVSTMINQSIMVFLLSRVVPRFDTTTETANAELLQDAQRRINAMGSNLP